MGEPHRSPWRSTRFVNLGGVALLWPKEPPTMKSGKGCKEIELMMGRHNVSLVHASGVVN